MIWPQYHEHPILSGESAGLTLGHSHGFFAEGHTHREHCFPARADGGFWADYGACNSHRSITVEIDGKTHTLPAECREGLMEVLAPYLAHARPVL